LRYLVVTPRLGAWSTVRLVRRTGVQGMLVVRIRDLERTRNLNVVGGLLYTCSVDLFTGEGDTDEACARCASFS
jgi:hypothetical protein